MAGGAEDVTLLHMDPARTGGGAATGTARAAGLSWGGAEVNHVRVV